MHEVWASVGYPACSISLKVDEEERKRYVCCFWWVENKNAGLGFKYHSHQTCEKSCRVHSVCVAETANRLEPASVSAGAGMVVSRCNDSANGLAAEGSWLHSRQGKEISIYSKTSGPALGPTHPSIQWTPVDLTTG
jgi:hypothetical protein